MATQKSTKPPVPSPGAAELLIGSKADDMATDYLLKALSERRKRKASAQPDPQATGDSSTSIGQGSTGPTT